MLWLVVRMMMMVRDDDGGGGGSCTHAMLLLFSPLIPCYCRSHDLTHATAAVTGQRSRCSRSAAGQPVLLPFPRQLNPCCTHAPITQPMLLLLGLLGTPAAAVRESNL